MKVVVIGLGSMGKRRIRLMKKIDENITVFGVDANADRCKDASKLYGIVTYSSIQDAKNNNEIECAFVCTSPLSHANIIEECLTNGWNVFTELNLVTDKYEENMKLAKEKGCVLFLSSTFFYQEEIMYIQKETKDKDKLNYIYHIGQYLPDWHPWESYKDFFIGNKRTNGCREIMAIEFPWLVGTFGDVKEFNVVSDKITNLNIEYNDNYLIQLVHENGNKGALIVDVVSPNAVRKLEIYGEGLYLSWDGTPETLMKFDNESKELKNVELYTSVDHVEGYSAFVVENAYQNEIQEFLDVVYKGITPQYGFEKDMQILNLIDEIEGIE